MRHPCVPGPDSGSRDVALDTVSFVNRVDVHFSSWTSRLPMGDAERRVSPGLLGATGCHGCHNLSRFVPVWQTQLS